MFLEWKFKRIRLKEQKKLNSSNLYLYKSMTVYIQNSHLSLFEKEDILQQIMDMMLQAQLEGRTVDLIVGEDYKSFCESIIREYSSSKNSIYNLLNYIQKTFLWTILISLSIMLLEGILSYPSIFAININQLVLAGVISLIIIPAAKKERQKTSAIFYIPQRFYSINKGLTKSSWYAFFSALSLLVLLNLIFEKTMGSEILTNPIALNKIIPYTAVLFLMIISIETYKRIYNRL